MLCKRCPHLVRHGQLASDRKNIEFKNICGLILKAETALENPQAETAPARRGPKKASTTPKKKSEKNMDCGHFPFPAVFDYIDCKVYLETFKTVGRRNEIIPTTDFQYSDALSGSSITDMELL